MKKKKVEDIKVKLKDFGRKLGRALSDIKTDAVYGGKIGGLKLQQLNLQKQNLKLFYDFGKKMYWFHKKKKMRFDEPEFLRYCKKIKANEDKIKRFQAKIKGVSEKIKPIHLS